MNYGFLVVMLVIGTAMGIVGWIAAGRERLASASPEPPTAPRRQVHGASYVVSGRIRPEILVEAMSEADKLPANRAMLNYPNIRQHSYIYETLWKKQSSSQSMQ